MESRIARLMFLLFIGFHPFVSTAKANSACTTEIALDQLAKFTWNAGAEKAKITIPMLKRLDAILANLTNQNLPVGAQLSADQSAEFERLSTEIAYQNYLDLFRGNLLRDALVTKKLVDAAVDPTYIDHVPPKGTDEAKQYFLYVSLALLPEVPFENFASGGACTMQVAIENLRDDISSKVDAQRYKQVSERLLAIKAKFNVDGENWVSQIKDTTAAKEASSLLFEYQQASATIVVLMNLQKIDALQNLSDRRFGKLISTLNKANNKAEMDQVSNALDDLPNPEKPYEAKLVELLDKFTTFFPSDQEAQTEKISRALSGTGLVPQH